MAKNDNLKDFVTDVANAIRAKKGTSELINPQDFAEEIDAISGGSGDTVEYLDLRNQQNELKVLIGCCCELVRVSGEQVGGEGVMPPAMVLANLSDPTALADIVIYGAIDIYKKVNVGIEMTMKDLIAMQVGGIDVVPSIPRITKEQFYSLD